MVQFFVKIDRFTLCGTVDGNALVGPALATKVQVSLDLLCIDFREKVEFDEANVRGSKITLSMGSGDPTATIFPSYSRRYLHNVIVMLTGAP